MNLEETSRKRKDQLLALRSKLKKIDDASAAANNDDAVEVAVPRPKFRSYQPHTESLKGQIVAAALPASLTEKVAADIAERQTSVITSVDIADLAPRKPDWDLKRALAPKLRKLDRRTERAMADIVRERLQREVAASQENSDEGDMDTENNT